MQKLQELLVIQPEIAEALQRQQPVVALESTIITHGMPYPKNVEMAMQVEAAVSREGAVPATIAIKDGKCLVGLPASELEFFGQERATWKVSLRDMPYVISQRLPGGTTVAATMRIAAMAGIKLFATGGIGGVHRGAQQTMDISADLTEMAQTSVSIVSAGVKSILDIGLTLEYLETKGIPVVTYGQDEFPGFYSSRSGFKSPLRLDHPKQIAEMIHAKEMLGLEGAVLVANPVPPGQQVAPEVIEKEIRLALEQASKENISGKAVTPFLLTHIAEGTRGESLEANIALVINNAELAARIAVHLQELGRGDGGLG